jgi:hypothetical protein
MSFGAYLDLDTLDPLLPILALSLGKVKVPHLF